MKRKRRREMLEEFCRKHVAAVEFDGYTGRGTARKTLNADDVAITDHANVLAKRGKNKLQRHCSPFDCIEFSVEECA